MAPSVPNLNDPSLLIDKCYVNGEFISASSGRTFDVHDPSTGIKIASCPEFSRQDTENAVAAADAAFSQWKSTLPRTRANLLRKWYDEIQKNAEDIATLITWEVRRSISIIAGCLMVITEWQSFGGRKDRGAVRSELLPMV